MTQNVFQPTLFAIGRATEDLFADAVLRQHVSGLPDGHLGNVGDVAEALRKWARVLAGTPGSGRGQRRTLNESNLEQSFNSAILCGVFGFTLPGTGEGGYTLLPKKSSVSGIPDAVFGFGAGEHIEIVGTVELKTPGTNLDAPQSRESKETPVEQAFRASRSIQSARWIIVTNLDEIRLYHISQPNRYFKATISGAVTSQGLANQFRSALAVLHRTQVLGSEQGSPSNTDVLLERTDSANAAIRGGFYDLFTQARADLYVAILAKLPDRDQPSGRRLALSKAQKLLDRIIFIRFCEDHPYELLQRRRLQTAIHEAPKIPGRLTNKVYQACKGYFDEIRLGSVPGAAYTVFAYDGELFDDDPVLDHIDLGDELFRKRYETRDRTRAMIGPFGFWEYNFSVELNEHLLGNIYEKSLADLERGELPVVTVPRRQTTSAIRSRYGIWYTPQTLTDYLASAALTPILDRLYETHVASIGTQASAEVQREALEAYVEAILALRILDPSCGSGAFLVSCFDVLAAACRGARLAIEDLSDSAQPALFESVDNRLMHECLYGIDLNPEAVAITKLALWLKMAHKREVNVDLGDRVVSGDSLDGERRFPDVEFDLVTGNPPWGAVWTDAQREEYRVRFGFEREDIRSEEAFIRLAQRYIKPGGILAYVLPDTILHPEKLETRRLLLEQFVIRRFHQLGPEWFTAHNRMSTVVVVATYQNRTGGEQFRSFTLVDKDRKAAIKEVFSLFQADARYSGAISQDRCISDGPEGFEIRLFQTASDDALMAKMHQRSLPLYRKLDGQPRLTKRGRGIELNKEGLILQCPACAMWVEPPEWNADELRYEPKTCRHCGHEFRFEQAASRTIVIDRKPRGKDEALYVIGEHIHRYAPLQYRAIELDAHGIDYHRPAQYLGPKILFRQAGVGINVVLDPTDAYFPQSVYVYRVAEPWTAQGYSNGYLVGVLSSRVMHYYLFKRFGEIDSARAHVKVTHERLADFPIPLLDTPSRVRLAEEIDEKVNAMLATPGHEALDREIEDRVATLFDLRPKERAYINGQFGLAHKNETIDALFPHGPPSPISLDDDPELL